MNVRILILQAEGERELITRGDGEKKGGLEKWSDFGHLGRTFTLLHHIGWREAGVNFLCSCHGSYFIPRKCHSHRAIATFMKIVTSTRVHVQLDVLKSGSSARNRALKQWRSKRLSRSYRTYQEMIGVYEWWAQVRWIERLPDRLVSPKNKSKYDRQI